MERCPGTRMETLLRTCPSCGKEVEFLDYDFERTCSNCGKRLFREADQSCVVWCKYAEVCIDDMLTRKLISPDTAEKLREASKKGDKGKKVGWEKFF